MGIDNAPERSKTAPVSPRPIVPSPRRRSKTTFSRLDALQQAYAAMTDNASQIPVKDLVQATKLVHQIGTALNEQMSKRFGRDD